MLIDRAGTGPVRASTSPARSRSRPSRALAPVRRSHQAYEQHRSRIDRFPRGLVWPVLFAVEFDEPDVALTKIERDARLDATESRDRIAQAISRRYIAHAPELDWTSVQDEAE